MDKQLTLRDGRTMTYAVYGATAGRPVVYCHGYPASRYEAQLTDTAARAMNLTVFAPDRPGYGGSDFWPGRSMLDWSRDVIELTDNLGIERFSVLGTSGGGPYALTCAHCLPERVSDLSLVCPLGPMDTFDSTLGMRVINRLIIGFAQQLPRISQGFNENVLAPVLRWKTSLMVRLLTSVSPPADREVLERPHVNRIVYQSLAEGLRSGGEGPAWDMHLYTRYWGFSLVEVAQPTNLWHGEQDTTVPLQMAKDIASQLPKCQGHFLPDHGHFSLPVLKMKSILECIPAP